MQLLLTHFQSVFRLQSPLGEVEVELRFEWLQKIRFMKGNFIAIAKLLQSFGHLALLNNR